MRSSLGVRLPARERRAWQAPAFVELPIAETTKSAAGPAINAVVPDVAPAPAMKLGFSFEMSLPLSVRTE